MRKAPWEMRGLRVLMSFEDRQSIEPASSAADYPEVLPPDMQDLHVMGSGGISV